MTDQKGRYLWYEVGLNQAYYEYVNRFSYWEPDHQVQVVQNYIDYVKNHGVTPPNSENPTTGYFQALPNGAEGYLAGLPAYARQGIVEWKAAWKVLDEADIQRRFYRQWGYLMKPDGTCEGPLKLGLAGFHIHRVTPRGGHIGTTFEQVDNVKLQRAYSDREVTGAAPLPAQASLNPGGETPPSYANGYEVCDPEGRNCQSGKAGLMLAPIKKGQQLPDKRQITNIVRQVEIPEAVRAANTVWRKKLRGTALFYYQMIGTQNGNIDEPNDDLGPGVKGAQVSNTTNLINTTLESYTQKGWSCALCHQNATPLGVTYPLPPFSREYDALRTISFLLQQATAE